MKVAVIVGTRPEIIKMASLIKILRKEGIEHNIIHTGQHYDRNLSEVFFEELNLPRADVFLDVGSGTQAEQTAKALVKIEKALSEIKPDVVLVEGDTNTVLAGALAGIKIGIDVGHVESGLRSYDIRMPEEHNRRVTDNLSSLLFAPTEHSFNTLKNENVWGEIYITGNTVIDACLEYLPIAEERSSILEAIEFENFALVTAHRAENVDDAHVLKNFVEVFKKSPLPIVYPIHPRTVLRLKEFGFYDDLSASENIKLLPPVGYLDFLVLMKHCTFIMSDSGGIQEEVTAPNIRKKVFVLRESTERPESVESGFAEVVGTDADNILSAINKPDAGRVPSECKSPYGEGDSGARIIEILKKKFS